MEPCAVAVTSFLDEQPCSLKYRFYIYIYTHIFHSPKNTPGRCWGNPKAGPPKKAPKDSHKLREKMLKGPIPCCREAHSQKNMKNRGPLYLVFVSAQRWARAQDLLAELKEEKAARAKQQAEQQAARLLRSSQL